MQSQLYLFDFGGHVVTELLGSRTGRLYEGYSTLGVAGMRNRSSARGRARKREGRRERERERGRERERERGRERGIQKKFRDRVVADR